MEIALLKYVKEWESTLNGALRFRFLRKKESLTYSSALTAAENAHSKLGIKLCTKERFLRHSHIRHYQKGKRPPVKKGSRFLKFLFLLQRLKILLPGLTVYLFYGVRNNNVYPARVVLNKKELRTAMISSSSRTLRRRYTFFAKAVKSSCN